MKKLFGLLIILFISTSLFAIDFNFIQLDDPFDETILKLRQNGYSFEYKDQNWICSKKGENIDNMELLHIKVIFVNNYVASVCYTVNCKYAFEENKLYDLFLKNMFLKKETLETYKSENDGYFTIKHYVAFGTGSASFLILNEAMDQSPGICAISWANLKD